MARRSERRNAVPSASGSAIPMIGRCMKRQGTVLVSASFVEGFPHTPHPVKLETLSQYVPNLLLWTGYGHTPVLSLKDDDEPSE